MTFKSHYPFKCILKYIPKRYTNLKDWQLANQKAVCDFKNGKISKKWIHIIILELKNNKIVQLMKIP